LPEKLIRITKLSVFIALFLESDHCPDIPGLAGLVCGKLTETGRERRMQGSLGRRGLAEETRLWSHVSQVSCIGRKYVSSKYGYILSNSSKFEDHHV
jgi:hypothetical protein